MESFLLTQFSMDLLNTAQLQYMACDLELLETISQISSLHHLVRFCLLVDLWLLDQHAHTFLNLESYRTISLGMFYLEHFITSRKTLSIRVVEDLSDRTARFPHDNATYANTIKCFDLQVLVEHFNPVDNNTGVLELGVTTINFSLDLNIFKLLHGHGRWAIPLDKGIFKEIP
ncbi:hypothetical protein Tco_1135078, partial [Tanacetum coccineum]